MIQFTEDYTVKPDGPAYKKDSTHALRASSEAHFVRNGVAVIVTAPEAPAEAIVEPEPAESQEATDLGKDEPVAEDSPASPPAQVSPETTAKRRGRPPKSSLQ